MAAGTWGHTHRGLRKDCRPLSSPGDFLLLLSPLLLTCLGPQSHQLKELITPRLKAHGEPWTFWNILWGPKRERNLGKATWKLDIRSRTELGSSSPYYSPFLKNRSAVSCYFALCLLYDLGFAPSPNLHGSNCVDPFLEHLLPHPTPAWFLCNLCPGSWYLLPLVVRYSFPLGRGWGQWLMNRGGRAEGERTAVFRVIVVIDWI